MGDLSSIIAELERMYGEAVSRWFVDPEWNNAARQNLADRPVISVASRGRKRTIGGWYAPAVWFDSTEELLAALAGVTTDVEEPVKRAEIVVASEVLGDPVQTVAEMCRQMAQHAAPELRVPLTSYYYSQAWVPVAERFGCTASVNIEQPSRGWSKLEPSSDFKQWCDKTLDATVFDVERDQTTNGERAGSRMHKWTCGCTVIRGAVAVASVCVRCKRPFHWADPNEQPSMAIQESVAKAFNGVVEPGTGVGWEQEFTIRVKRNNNP